MVISVVLAHAFVLGIYMHDVTMLKIVLNSPTQLEGAVSLGEIELVKNRLITFLFPLCFSRSLS